MSSDFLRKKQGDLEGTVKNQADYLANSAKGLGKVANAAYSRHMGELEGFKNLGYKKDDIDIRKIVNRYVKDKQDKKDLEVILYKIDTEVNKGKSITYGYKDTIDTLVETAQTYDRVMKDNTRRQMNAAYIQQLQDKRHRYQEKLTGYQQRLEEVRDKLLELQTKGRHKLSETAQKVRKGGDTGLVGNMIIIAMTAAFGGSVVYALSNVRLSDVSAGAFVAAPVLSPMVMLTAAAAVIFFLFMATHHKLEQAA